MSHYADTSLLISYYIKDSQSVSAQTVLHRATDPLPFTGLHRLEMRNTLALGVFRRILTSAQVSTAWSDVERDFGWAVSRGDHSRQRKADALRLQDPEVGEASKNPKAVGRC
jgi:hypothetical protein